MLSRIILFIALCATWLILSGFFSPFFVVIGLLSCSAATVLFVKMNIDTGGESRFAILLLRLPMYLFWLVKEIVMSSLSVSKKMWQLEPEISPDFIWVPTSLKDDLGLTILGNSITLTPGTLTTSVRHDGMVQVHCLTKEGAESVRGSFLTKVTKFVSKKEQKT